MPKTKSHSTCATSASSASMPGKSSKTNGISTRVAISLSG
jgi:hypothetical protein